MDDEEEIFSIFSDFQNKINKDRKELLKSEMFKDAVERLHMSEEDFNSIPINDLIVILMNNIKDYSLRICKFLDNQKERILTFLELLGEDAYYIAFATQVPTISIEFDNGIKNKKLSDSLIPYIIEGSDNSLLLPLTPALSESEVYYIIDLIMGAN